MHAKHLIMIRISPTTEMGNRQPGDTTQPQPYSSKT